MEQLGLETRIIDSTKTSNANNRAIDCELTYLHTILLMDALQFLGLPRRREPSPGTISRSISCTYANVASCGKRLLLGSIGRRPSEQNKKRKYTRNGFHHERP